MIMKHFRLLTAFAATAALLAACSESSDIVTQTDGRQNLGNEENVVKFSTYMGRTNTTRGGAYGSINTSKLRDANYGFGVFAYYTNSASAGSTPTTDYASYRTQNDATDRYPNFMYNERIIGGTGSTWTYANINNTKYWPNEVQNGRVDDQNNDAANDPATSTDGNGGLVSFFAYAPYIAEADENNKTGIDNNPVAATNDGTTSGIIAFSGNAFNGGTSSATGNAKNRFSDPYVKYKISNENSKQVDLLWGTTMLDASGSSMNGVNVNGIAQNGSKSNLFKDYNDDGSAVLTSTDPKRPEYYVNTDLTKQKTNGTVAFAFKHALAKIGGSFVKGTTSYDGSDDDATTPTNGLLVILDIDKEGKELGGTLQPYTGTPLETGSIAAKNKNNTKVTITEIKLENDGELTAAGVTAVKNNTFTHDNAAYVQNLRNQGIFNLVTGVWHGLVADGASTRTQTIEQTDIKLSDPSTETADDDKDAVLNANIAEPKAINWTNDYTKAAFEKLPIGVTTVAKNVYQSDAQPFVFIPGTNPIIKITIDYTVRTYDAKLAKKYSEVRQKITKRLYILDEIQVNKQYNILMHLGLTSVKFTADVSDWEPKDATASSTTPGTGGATPVATYDDTMDHVYLPANVAGLSKIHLGATEITTDKSTATALSAVSATTTSVNLGVVKFEYADGKKHTSLATDDLDNNVYGNKVAIAEKLNVTGFAGSSATINDAGEVVVTLPENNTASTANYNVGIIYGDYTLTVTIPQNGRLITSASVVDDSKLTITAPTKTTNVGVVTLTYDDANTYASTLEGVTVTATGAAASKDAPNGEVTVTFSGSNTVNETAIVNVKYCGEAPANYQVKTLTVTKNAGTLTVTPSSASVASGGTVTLTVKADEENIDMSGTGITVKLYDDADAEVATGWSHSDDVVTMPTAAGTYKIGVKVNDTAEVKTSEITVAP